jgi:hypothetical protein
LRLRATKKMRALQTLLRKGRVPSAAVARVRLAQTHEEAYWVLHELGFLYDPDTGWYVEPATGRARENVGVRLLGPREAVIAAEAQLRAAGLSIVHRRGPSRGDGGAFLTYLDVLVNLPLRAGVKPNASVAR